MKVLWTQTPGSEETSFFGELKSLYPDVEFKFAENIEQELEAAADAEIYYGWPSDEVFNKLIKTSLLSAAIDSSVACNGASIK